MKLEVGMYVRFKDRIGNTYIRKIKKLADEHPQKLYGMEVDKEANYSIYLSTRNIYKASHNIIDLIEVGDYVNGDVVIVIWEDKEEQILGEAEPRHLMTRNGEKIYNEDIKSIVTKEMFESMSYKVNR